MTKAKLQQYQWLLKEIEQLKAEYDALAMGSLRGCGGDNVGCGRSSVPKVVDTVAITAEKRIVLQQQITRKVDTLIGLRCEVEDWLDEVADAQARVIIRERYIKGRMWYQIARECCNSADECVPRMIVTRLLHAQ